MQREGTTPNLDFEEDDSEPGSGWSLSNFLIRLVGLMVLIAVPITVPKCQPDPIAWIKGESSFCTTSSVSSHSQRSGHITRQYHGAGTLSGLDEIELYALKGERIGFTYSTAISRGAIRLELKEKQTFGSVRAGPSAWSSGYMEQSGSETASVTASSLGVYYFVIHPASSAEGSIDLSWEVN